MRGRRLTWLIVLAAILIGAGLLLVSVPWLRSLLPHPRLVEAWLNYLVVDLDIGRWGPVATLLLVGLIELVWAVSLGRRSGAFERQWKRLERVHARELEVSNQKLALFEEQKRLLRAELELHQDLIREERARLWSEFEDLQRNSGLLPQGEEVHQRPGGTLLHSRLVSSEVPQLTPDVSGQWRQVISQLERIEVVDSVTKSDLQSPLESQQRTDELLRLGAACYYLGQYERAISHYNKAVDLAPNDPQLLINRAVVNHALGRTQPAIRDLDQALSLNGNPWAFLYRGLIRHQQGDLKRALEDLSRTIRLDAESAEAYYRRGLVHAELGEYDLAFEDQNRALALEPEHAGGLTARGVARAALGEASLALEDLNQGCVLAPDSHQAFFHRGCVRQWLGMYQEALADFGRVIELGSASGQVYLARADTYTALGNHWQAISDYSRAIELQPKNATAHHGRGMARAAMNDYQQAIQDFNRAVELDGGLAECVANRGAAHEQLGEHLQAIEDLDRALELAPDLALAYYHRGLAYGSVGDYDKASRDLNRAAELDPTFELKHEVEANKQSVEGDGLE
ncbi:MAG: tetratricopeptide repeat protein [Anaerolineae bacterium]|nr:tetratricopeptide repeat protein [Anaerolineae bacterium]